MYYFMIKQFGEDEALNSIMAKLRGKYAVLAYEEQNKPNPNQEKITRLMQHSMAVHAHLRTVFTESDEQKSRAIEKYNRELLKLRAINKGDVLKKKAKAQVA
jgi:hypothetical protein